MDDAPVGELVGAVGEEQGDTKLPLISVIVPIYNVEKYVRKCLDSLLNQTMKQIEVIVIDDGSTDGSGMIADEYKSSEYPIFRVFHTANRGLSAARNRGLDEARSEWLMFVDSDDWVDREFCRIPYEASQEYGVDMVVFRAYTTTESGRVKQSKRINTINGFTDFETLIDGGNTVAWNKLYKKYLFNTIRYPESHVYEDVSTTHKVIYNAKNIYKCGEQLYYHRCRKGSISRSTSSRTDEYKAKVQRCRELVDYGYPKEKVNCQLLMASLAYCGHAANTEDHLYREARETVHEIKVNEGGFMLKQRAMLRVWKMNEHLYRTVYWMLGKRMTR